MSATSGRSLPEPLAHYDPRTSCWRMSGGMFPSDSMPSLPTLPDWGMTQGGELSELQTPALPMAELESSLLHLMPTPRAQARDLTDREDYHSNLEEFLHNVLACEFSRMERGSLNGGNTLPLWLNGSASQIKGAHLLQTPSE